MGRIDRVVQMVANRIREDIPSLDGIRDEDLREAVVRTWLAALDLGEFESIAAASQSAAFPSRSLLSHVNEVAELALWFLTFATNRFGLTPDEDVVLAAAILHDVDKVFICHRDEDGGLSYREGYSMNDHGPAGAEVALECGVPNQVAELIRNHPPFTYTGELPGTPEGTIVHYADLAAADLAAVEQGAVPIHARSLIVKKEHPLFATMRNSTPD